MSEFTKRTLFGALYVAAVVGCILWGKLAFGILVFFISIMATREYLMLVGAPKKLVYTSMNATGNMVIATMCYTMLSHRIFMVMGMIYFISVGLVLLDELWHKGENPIQNWGNMLTSQSMIALPFCTMLLLNNLDKWLMLAVFVLIWINDSGAYCVGSLTAKRPGGNHKMFPRVSPNKSWEGLFGGLVFTWIGAIILMQFGWFDKLIVTDYALANGTKYVIVLFFALLASEFGTLGDLMESLMKRTVGVKDSGKFLPGHGGVLDRFDSMLLATPVMLLFSLLCYALSHLW